MDLFEAFDLEAIWQAAEAMRVSQEQSTLLQAQQEKELSNLEYMIEQQKLIRDDESKSYQDRINANIEVNKLLETADSQITYYHEQRRQEYLETLKNDENNIAAKTALIQLDAEINARRRSFATQEIETRRAQIQLTREEEDAASDLDLMMQRMYENRNLNSNISFKQQTELVNTAYARDAELINQRLANEEEFSQRWYQIMEERNQRFAEFTEQRLQIMADENAIRTQTIYDVAQTSASIASTLAGENKEVQTATALINTFVGVSQALASAPPPYSFIQAGLVLATGLANVAKIQSTQVPSYAKGIEYLTGDPQGPTGGIFVEAHKGERIVPEVINRHMVGIDNSELPGMIKVGLQFPALKTGIGELVGLQRENNRMLGKWAYFDNKGNMHKLNGDIIRYN